MHPTVPKTYGGVRLPVIVMTLAAFSVVANAVTAHTEMMTAWDRFLWVSGTIAGLVLLVSGLVRVSERVQAVAQRGSSPRCVVIHACTWIVALCALVAAVALHRGLI